MYNAACSIVLPSFAGDGNPMTSFSVWGHKDQKASSPFTTELTQDILTMIVPLKRLSIIRISPPTLLRSINRTRFAAFHAATAPSSDAKPTPKIYLEDDYVVNKAGGITEEEGAGGKNPGVAEQYVLAGVPKSEVSYGVPGGPYHTGDPLEAPRNAAKPATGEFSSTSPDYAHPLLTKKAARVEDGEGSSSALRYRDAPGHMVKGSDGGRRLSEGVQTTENTLGDRNPQPQAKFSDDSAREAKKK